MSGGGSAWPAVPRRSSAEDEYHEDPVAELCLAGLPASGSAAGSGPTRPPDVALPLHDPDWRFEDGGQYALLRSTMGGAVGGLGFWTTGDRRQSYEQGDVDCLMAVQECYYVPHRAYWLQKLAMDGRSYYRAIATVRYRLVRPDTG